MRDGFICSEFNARTSVERDGISWDCNLKDMAILTTRRRVSAERTFDSHRSDSHRNALLVTCYNGLENNECGRALGDMVGRFIWRTHQRIIF